MERVLSVKFNNVASFVDRLDVDLEIPGFGTHKVDTAFGGDSFVLIDAASLGFGIVPDEAADLARVGVEVIKAANEQLGFSHPEVDWNHISFCQFTGELEKTETGFKGKNTVAIRPAKLDRSPTGTGCSARMAVLHAKGRMKVGDTYLARSVIGSEFHCSIHAEAKVGDRGAIVPSIRGRGWITGTHQHTVDPSDPWPLGYRLSDTWPRMT